jgi:hypothetical protein
MTKASEGLVSNSIVPPAAVEFKLRFLLSTGSCRLCSISAQRRLKARLSSGLKLLWLGGGERLLMLALLCLVASSLYHPPRWSRFAAGIWFLLLSSRLEKLKYHQRVPFFLGSLCPCHLHHHHADNGQTAPWVCSFFEWA